MCSNELRHFERTCKDTLKEIYITEKIKNYSMVEWNNNSCQTFHDRYRLYTEGIYLLKHTENILQRNEKSDNKERGYQREFGFFSFLHIIISNEIHFIPERNVYNVLRNILKLYFVFLFSCVENIILMYELKQKKRATAAL